MLGCGVRNPDNCNFHVRVVDNDRLTTRWERLPSCLCTTLEHLRDIDLAQPTSRSISPTMTSAESNSPEGPKPKISMEYDKETKTVNTYVQMPGQRRKRKVPQTEEEIEEAFPYEPLETPRPELPSQETLDLYTKVVDAPDSITEEQRLEIQDWVSEDVADERCREACGMAWQELVTVAVERPQHLTEDEVFFISSGRSTTYKDSSADMDRLMRRIRQPEHITKLW